MSAEYVEKWDTLIDEYESKDKKTMKKLYKATRTVTFYVTAEDEAQAEQVAENNFAEAAAEEGREFVIDEIADQEHSFKDGWAEAIPFSIDGYDELSCKEVLQQQSLAVFDPFLKELNDGEEGATVRINHRGSLFFAALNDCNGDELISCCGTGHSSINSARDCLLKKLKRMAFALLSDEYEFPKAKKSAAKK